MDTRTKLFWWCHCPRVHSVMEYECAVCKAQSSELACRDATHQEVLDKFCGEIIEFAHDYLDDRKSKWTPGKWLAHSRMLTKYVSFLLRIGFVGVNYKSVNEETGQRYYFTTKFQLWYVEFLDHEIDLIEQDEVLDELEKGDYDESY